jgi:high-affinity nickel-transport protein
MTITLLSVLVAVVIGGIEALGLISDQLKLKGGAWNLVGKLNDHFNDIGFVIIGLFVAAFAISFVVYKAKRLDEIEIASSSKGA